MFSKIAGEDNTYFTLESFLKIYSSKPEVVSWFDYFKEEDSSDLTNLVSNIEGILKTLNTFFKKIDEVLLSLILTSRRR